MNKILKTLAACAIAILPAATFAKTSEADQVRKMIDKVNQHWQAENKPEVRSFWDNAAYHTGNMEAYFLTGNEDYRAYSEAWARHNEWKGAKSNDRSHWKYSYGESDEYVLFGDYQICFQTYADLYNLAPEDYKIRRAREVMEYQMSTPNNDYWWWSDGLYMVMPVMTKLYKITHNSLYLDKLYEYITYSDQIMFDKEENLYYRDAKYVYPKHKSVNGKKDFWARGDGWVLAGLAKVLKDLPADYKYRPFFVEKFQKMAKAVAAIQLSKAEADVEGLKSYVSMPSASGYLPVSRSTSRLFPAPLGPMMAMCSSAPKATVAGSASLTCGRRGTPAVRHIVCCPFVSISFCCIYAAKIRHFHLRCCSPADK